MIEQWSDDRTGWALFSDDMIMRYRLARSFTPFSPDVERLNGSPRAVFVLCNSSWADAFKPDPTVGECVKRSKEWGMDMLDVVNLWAFRSQFPVDLRKRAIGQRGDDDTNNAAILEACRNARIVIAGWGKNGELDNRASIVLRMLKEHGVALHHLGLTKEGYPKHPLARGVHRIPAGQQPVPWSYA